MRIAQPNKLPSGKWNVKVFSHMENGKRKYVSFTSADKHECARKALEFMENKKYSNSPQDMTIKVAVEKYIESKANILSPKTLMEYKKCVQYYKNIENIRLGQLRSQDLQYWVNDISVGRKPKTVRNIYGVLISAINAQETGRQFKVTLPAKQEPERNIPIDADVKRMLDLACPSLRKAILLASVGTLRRGEICALKYKDILRDFNAVYVHSDIVLGDNGWVYKEIPKTSKSTRRVVLPKEIIDELGNGDLEEYVLGVYPSTVTSDFINLRNKLGLKCTFHDLRHYAASILHSIGVPDVYIMERGGWKNDGVLKSVYRNSLSDKSIHFSSVANDYLTNALSLESKNAKAN